MSRHHDAARWANVSKGHRARIRARGRVQWCIQPAHVPDCPGALDLDVVRWDVAHVRDLADGPGGQAQVGPAYYRCNRTAGGQRGARTIHAQRRDTARMRAW